MLPTLETIAVATRRVHPPNGTFSYTGLACLVQTQTPEFEEILRQTFQVPGPTSQYPPEFDREAVQLYRTSGGPISRVAKKRLGSYRAAETTDQAKRVRLGRTARTDPD